MTNKPPNLDEQQTHTLLALQEALTNAAAFLKEGSPEEARKASNDAARFLHYLKRLSWKRRGKPREDLNLLIRIYSIRQKLVAAKVAIARQPETLSGVGYALEMTLREARGLASEYHSSAECKQLLEEAKAAMRELAARTREN